VIYLVNGYPCRTADDMVRARKGIDPLGPSTAIVGGDATPYALRRGELPMLPPPSAPPEPEETKPVVKVAEPAKPAPMHENQPSTTGKVGTTINLLA